MQLATLYFETRRVAEAGRTAGTFRMKMSGWTPPPLGENPSIGFVEYAYRAGLLSKSEVEDERKKWIAAEEEREGRFTKRRWRQNAFRWATAYAGFAETEAEAKEALAKREDFEPMPADTRRTVRFDFAVGKAYALAGRYADAEPYLARATAACVALTTPQIHTRAHYDLGRVREAKGDAAGARHAYGVVLQRWGSAAPASRTADDARARLAGLRKL
jgi:TolA-binding protein